MKCIKIFLVLLLSVALASCSKYLDVVPDNVATIENAFSSRNTAEKFLFTCYAYLPAHGSPTGVPFTAGDEFWLPFPQNSQYYFNDPFEMIARDNQSAFDPSLNYWDGSRGGKPMFRAIRDCNIFLENIDAVPGMQSAEKKRWIAEVKFLKAYYHFWLVKLYGPVPLIKENLPISAGVDEVKAKREPVDSCFAYIESLLDEAVPDLPLTITDEANELGRISRVTCLSVKASIMVAAASPLFNGNTDYTGFKDKEGTTLFNTAYDQSKWEKAAESCKEAVLAAEEAGLQLYRYTPVVSGNTLSETTITQMSIRNSIAEKWNAEIIWANPNSLAENIQRLAQARIDPLRIISQGPRSLLAPPLKMAELFYTKNGVPIEEDRTWDYDGRYALRTATEAEKYNLQPGYQTVALHFDRENRFYADLAFDGSVWYGQGRYDDNSPFVVQARRGQSASRTVGTLYSVTGYWPKKLVHYQNIILEGSGQAYSVVPYPWPVMRLADLYLLYAEALNESGRPYEEVCTWLNLVRERAGLLSVQESWKQFSTNPSKYTTQNGLRDIIQQERLIEMAFEGQRFWDLRRWKKAREVLNNNQIQGWDIEQSEAALYYRVKTLYTKKFSNRDYFWPIASRNLLIDNELVQNPGW
ncbi:putative outer membrane starch-binding protein [Anseongella ginsenosidimutans]|uniref:Putative outer membrane starch-binding protein n=1 Tax=Anseongella ginsenosidimutans TaxID=496056 RepID=A0A4R3KSC5_9SPHI|nr:RagB/SusD family nutrient uptake outer membrane protein [Anseongella ginsenosidimutans]QEC53050.1 RagB/SusD family nutrient uptake outer membrane protein [Anseongella ginsenosidimutans]TCS87666.1 putative outer membrane starch-binding protein [Anseongella ginsenosidimutans]